MKRTALLGLLAAALVLQSACIVRSVNPWFNKSDVVFENDILGGWVGTDPGGKDVAMTFIRGEGDSYFVQYQTAENRGNFRAFLGKVAGEYYLDFRPVEGPPGIDGLLQYPMHCVARLEIGSDKLSIRIMNYEALRGLAKTDNFKDVKFAWNGDTDEDVLVTSSTDELRHFLVGRSRNSELFAEPIKLARKK